MSSCVNLLKKNSPIRHFWVTWSAVLSAFDCCLITLAHYHFRPSTTDEEFLESGDQEYFAAESLGRGSLKDCRRFSTDCETSPLKYFTESDD